MKRYLAYLKYVLRHKYFVTVECFKVGLYWRGLKHDLSKFTPAEFFPYARFFYAPDGSKINRRDITGYYKPTDTGDPAYDMAWFHHQKRNDHHWQWWLNPEDWRGSKLVPMSEDATQEMICDWRGAARAQGVEPDPEGWYNTNRDKLQLHRFTRDRIERFLGVAPTLYLEKTCDRSDCRHSPSCSAFAGLWKGSENFGILEGRDAVPQVSSHGTLYSDTESGYSGITMETCLTFSSWRKKEA